MESNHKRMGLKKIIKNVFRLMNMHKGKFVFTGMCTIISVIFTIISPILLGDAINIIIEGSANIINNTGTIDFNALLRILTLAAATYIITKVFDYLKRYYLSNTTTEIIYTLREELTNKVLQLPLSSVDENKRGDILSRFTLDLSIVNQALLSSFLQTTTSIIRIAGTLIMMLVINTRLTLTIILLTLISSGLIGIAIKISQKYFAKQMDIQGSVTGQIEEIFSAQEVIRSLNYEENAKNEFNQNVDEWCKYEWKSKFISSLNNPIIDLSSNIGYVLIAVMGGILVLQGTMSVGRVVTFFEYLKSFTSPIHAIIEIIPEIQAGIESIDRIFEFLEKDDEENPSTKELKEFKDEISFENVSFGYTEDKKIINDFSLTVKKGQKIAIIGETGAGKTTLIKLLMRLYDIDSGEIKIDGVNINEYDKNSLRSFMGMVLQEVWLFSDTIEENIRYGNLDSTEEDIINASKQANTDYFIKQLPEGYQTILEEDADNISQGQKQLLTIARAIISKKEILILDEATSNIDSRTEFFIQKAMDKLMENKTSFIVAHRLSTIRNADKIIVLGRGGLIEEGTHDELMAQKGYYYNILKN